ncbi:MAG TPA: T9SS type A sorting domain-containing protein, partial [Chitinophagaceae bacterium]|nr:T9SS type A sorting domain-containing protein [Chitinophagaceae bacterium]
SESNADYYQVERSSDGNSFSGIGKVDASGNSDSKLSYTWLDGSPNSGNNFYRVKSVDFDGHISYSSIVRINTGANTKSSISIYPNPVRGKQLTLQLNNLQKGSFSVKVFNRMGQQVSQSQLDISEENMTRTLQLPSGIESGTYNLIISNGILRLNKTFIIE